MERVAVTGIGILSALGKMETFDRVLSGRSAIRLQKPFPDLPAVPLATISPREGIANATATSILDLVLSCVTDAASDAGCFPNAASDGRSLARSQSSEIIGVAIGSSRCQQAGWEKLARQFYAEETQTFSPADIWVQSLPALLSTAVSRQIGVAETAIAPMAACATGSWAIALAFERVRRGIWQRAIAGAAEAPITPLTLAGFRKMGALAQTGCYPFDTHREGLVLGEGASIFILEPLRLARQRGAKIYGEILGCGFATDTFRAVAPQAEAEGAIAAIRQCLKRSRLAPHEIDYVCAHGTGTQLNDRCEALALRSLFPRGVPVSSIKGATGHTLGASGALGVFFALMAIERNVLPPCVGLRESAFPDLDLVGSARSSVCDRTLCSNFGFGGQNVAIALGRVR